VDFLRKLRGASVAILPLIGIVVFLNAALIWTNNPHLTNTQLFNFLIASVLVVIGQVIFLTGIDNSLNIMGAMTGSVTARFKKTIIVLGVVFVFGFLITIADPDIIVLADLVGGILPSSGGWTLMLVVALGVGVYTILAAAKTIFRIKIKYILLFSYAVILVLGYFSPQEFVPLAFDSGGVITGPITVPFILAMGIGIATVRGGKKSSDLSFGTVALAAIGPIIAILILGLVNGKISELEPLTYDNVGFSSVLFDAIKNVFIGVAPITLAFVVLQAIFVKLPRRRLAKITFGVALVYIGLVLFLAGINFGFSSAGFAIGFLVNGTNFAWVLVPVAVLIGIATVFTEPAIIILGEQVERVTSGNVKKRTIKYTLAAGVGLACMLAVLKITLEISIWWFVGPALAVALLMAFFTSDMFAGVAFDSGGVASGPITATFTLPLVIGIASVGANAGQTILQYAFGIVILVSIIPPILIQGLGIIGRLRENRKALFARHEIETFLEFARSDIDFSNLKEGINENR
jgi:hypothetical protein